MITTRLKITLELIGPVMTKSTTLGGYGIDSPMAQSGGHYYLPGSLVKGRLREALQELCAAAPDETKDWTIDDWFGVKTGNREESTRSFKPSRARILFDDFRDLKTRPDKIFDTRYRIQIDPKTKAVKKGALQLLEAPYASGAHVPLNPISGSLPTRSRNWIL